MFFGESMFSNVSDSSKVALTALCQQLSRWDMPLIDCQVHSDHLASLGALEIPRSEFMNHLNALIKQSPSPLPWVLDADIPTL
jgi:leucyl/phenylalanyl-tRNA--protein transferase